MLKLSPSRNQRSKGFKVKHVLQILLLLAIAVWLLNQFKRSYDKEEELKDGSGNISDEVQGEHEILKLGRKDLHPREETALNFESERENEELEEEMEDIKSEEIEEGRGGGDDEIDGHDQERAEEEEPEEIEDLIDVDDREKDVSVEQANELEGDQAHLAGERSFQELREEQFEGYDVSIDYNQEPEMPSNKSEIASIGKMQVSEVEDDHDINIEQGNKSHSTWNASVEVIDSGLKIRNKVNENGDHGNNVTGEEAHDVSSSSVPDSFANKELETNSRDVLEQTSGPQDGNGIGISSIHLDQISEGKQIDMQAVSGLQNSDGTVKNDQIDPKSTLPRKNENLAAVGTESVASAAGKLDSTAVSGGSSNFTIISRNVDALHNDDSESLKGEATDNAKEASH